MKLRRKFSPDNFNLNPSHFPSGNRSIKLMLTKTEALSFCTWDICPTRWATSKVNKELSAFSQRPHNHVCTWGKFVYVFIVKYIEESTLLETEVRQTMNSSSTWRLLACPSTGDGSSFHNHVLFLISMLCIFSFYFKFISSTWNLTGMAVLCYTFKYSNHQQT